MIGNAFNIWREERRSRQSYLLSAVLHVGLRHVEGGVSQEMFSKRPRCAAQLGWGLWALILLVSLAPLPVSYIVQGIGFTLLIISASMRRAASVDLEHLAREVARVIEETMQPVRMSLWLREREGQAYNVRGRRRSDRDN